MANKEEIYPEGYPRQTESFSDEQKFKFEVFEAIKEMALETTEKAFKDQGYSKQEGKAGEYGDGNSYGAGTSLNHFNIRLSSRPNTDTYFEKIIYFGGKKAITDVNIGWDAKNKTIEMAYKNSEFGAFRGYGSKAGAELINDRRNFVVDSIATFKKELKTLFKSFADKEVAYITSTKIGIEDKTEKSINSMVETNLSKSFDSIKELKNELATMKKYSIKDLMSSSDDDLSNTLNQYINEGKKDKEEDKARMNSPEVIAANSPGKLLFDDIEEIKDEKVKTAAKNKLKKFGVVAINELKPSEKKTYFEELEKELEINEVSASGGNAAGGAYLTPAAFKPGGDLNLGNAKFEETSYAKGQKPRPSVKKTKNEGDSFWTTVELNAGSGYVPKGMEKNFVMGQHAEKVNESEAKAPDASLLKESLIKRKFTTMNENTEKGINKRYIVTEKRTQDEENNRWKKLSLFETYETIRNAENLNECGCGAEDPHQVTMNQGEEEIEKDFMQRNTDAEVGGEVDGRVVIMVPKPNSLSNAMLKVYQDDYMNESKAYILDLNSGNLVSNPKFRATK
jgi:hypothetical protein